MALDARIRYKKKMIRGSFIRLLEKKAFHEIKLKEVCELAGINRSTFYKYYSGIYDGRERIEKECLARAREVIGQIDSTDLRTILVHILLEIQKAVDLYRVLFSRRSDVHIPEPYLAMSLEKTESVLRTQFLNLSDVQARWASYYGGYGRMGVIQCWIADDLRRPPEEAADDIVEILTKTMG